MTAPRVTSLRSLLLVTLIGCVVLAAPATMTHHPAAVGTAVVLGLWCLVVAAFGVLQLKQVGISSSGILAPCLVMVVGAQGVLFVMLATENQRARLRGLPLPPRRRLRLAVALKNPCQRAFRRPASFPRRRPTSNWQFNSNCNRPAVARDCESWLKRGSTAGEGRCDANSRTTAQALSP